MVSAFRFALACRSTLPLKWQGTHILKVTSTTSPTRLNLKHTKPAVADAKPSGDELRGAQITRARQTAAAAQSSAVSYGITLTGIISTMPSSVTSRKWGPSCGAPSIRNWFAEGVDGLFHSNVVQNKGHLLCGVHEAQGMVPPKEWPEGGA